MPVNFGRHLLTYIEVSRHRKILVQEFKDLPHKKYAMCSELLRAKADSISDTIVVHTPVRHW